MIITLTGIPAEGGAHPQQISQCGSPLLHGLVPTSIWAGLYILQLLLWFTGKRPLMCHSWAEWMRQKWHLNTWIKERKPKFTNLNWYFTSARGSFCKPFLLAPMSSAFVYYLEYRKLKRLLVQSGKYSKNQILQRVEYLPRCASYPSLWFYLGFTKHSALDSEFLEKDFPAPKISIGLTNSSPHWDRDDLKRPIASWFEDAHGSFQRWGP